MVSSLVSLVTKHFYQRYPEMKVNKLGGNFEARISEVISYRVEIQGLRLKLSTICVIYYFWVAWNSHRIDSGTFHTSHKAIEAVQMVTTQPDNVTLEIMQRDG